MSGEDVGLSIALAVLICLISYMAYLNYSVLFGRYGDKLLSSVAPDMDRTARRSDNWLLAARGLKLQQLLGSGVMGAVHKGRYQGTTVAIRQIKHTMSPERMSNELTRLMHIRHPQLVLLMGVSVPDSERVLVVSEYMEGGSLLTQLRGRPAEFELDGELESDAQHGLGNGAVVSTTQHTSAHGVAGKPHRCELTFAESMQMAVEVARAMSYLHSREPPVLHRRLDSKSVLLSGDLVPKVGDYGLNFLLGNMEGGSSAGVPVRPSWAAPEVLRQNKFSTKSDVYSFGVLLWQMITCQVPFAHARFKNNAAAVKAVIDGERPPIPAACPEELAAVIEACWHSDPRKRPSFPQLIPQLEALAKMTKFDISDIISVEVQAPRLNRIQSLQQLLHGSPWLVQADEFETGKLIGSGSLGSVFLGSFRGKTVAIKKISRGNVGEALLSSFVHELSVMNRLSHPNVVMFMGACLEENHMCILMEYCEHGSLFANLHDASVRMDYDKIIKILFEVAQGMNYLHLNKPPVIHRDLKSLNILVDEDWNAKVSDFGISNVGHEEELADPSIVQGTPFWLAPEAMSQNEFSPASDVYSFGMIVWELFTRKTPFPHMTAHQATLAVLSEDLRPDIPEFVPPRFVELIRRCWHRDPDTRPTFQQIIHELAVIEEEGLPRLELSLDNAQLFRKKNLVRAFPSRDIVTVYKSWGVGQSKPDDYVIVGPGDDVYTCDADIFHKTYQRVKTKPREKHVYRKVGKIFALQMHRPFLLQTLEGTEHGKKGDYVAQNPVDGEQWPIPQAKFEEMYELDPDQERVEPDWSGGLDDDDGDDDEDENEGKNEV